MIMRKKLNAGDYPSFPTHEYFSLYETLIMQLERLAAARDKSAPTSRHELYSFIREITGLTFAGWGDEPQQWIKWLSENKPIIGESSSPKQQQYTVVGWDGDQRYLLLRHDVYSTEQRPRGQIFDIKRPSLSDVFDIATLQADGAWQQAPLVVTDTLAHWLKESHWANILREL